MAMMTTRRNAVVLLSLLGSHVFDYCVGFTVSPASRRQCFDFSFGCTLSKNRQREPIRTRLDQLENGDEQVSQNVPTNTTSKSDATDQGAASTRKEKLPIHDLLQELDKQEIPYGPTATRSELEELLELRQHGSVADTKASSSKPQTETSTTEKLPIQHLLKELDRLNIRYPPTATRVQLESLVEQHQRDVVDRKPKKDSPTTAKSSPTQTMDATPISSLRLPIRQLLDELDQNGIKYPPTATRSMLERMYQETVSAAGKPKVENLQKHKRDNVSENSDKQQQEKKPAKTRAEGSPTDSEKETTQSTHLPIRQLLDELDRSGVKYPPTATRAVLERLYQENELQKNKVEKTIVAGDRTKRTKSLQEERKRKRKLRQEANKTPLDKIIDKTTTVVGKDVPRRVVKLSRDAKLSSRLSKVAERTIKKAKRVTNKAVQWWEEEEEDSKQDGDDVIREPDWYYVQKDHNVNEPIDVPAAVIVEEDNEDESQPIEKAPQRSRRRRTSGDTFEDRDLFVSSRETRRSRTPRPRQQRPTKRQRQRPPRKVVASPLFQLPSASQDTVSFPTNLDQTSSSSPSGTSAPAEMEPSSTSVEPPRRKRSPKKRKKKKRVYSPYGEVETEPEPDALDRFGEAIASAAEQVLWGPEGDMQPVTDNESTNKRKPSKRSSNTKHASKPPLPPRHWRDRLSKRLDSALGLDSKEQVYNSWEREMAGRSSKYQKYDQGDPLFQYLNHQAGVGKRKKKIQKKKETPFWEEEGNIVSVLFGRTKSGNRLIFDDFFDQANGVNVMSTLLRSIIKSALLIASYACRWASVRGAVPQPVVVVGVAAAALSSRPRRRLWAIGLTLVGMRTFGEMIHGYVYGDQDWEDDYYDEEEEENHGNREDPSISSDNHNQDKDSWEGDGL